MDKANGTDLHFIYKRKRTLARYIQTLGRKENTSETRKDENCLQRDE